MDDKRKSPGKGRTKSGERRPPPVDDAEAGGRERIAKRLARAGVASRREAEALITDGRVSVNGRVLDSPAFTVGPADRIEIDGEPIPAIERTRLFLFHKPAGVVTTNRDPEGRRTVFDVLPKGLPRVVTVGRLDLNTEGLLLLTNDGGLARVLELPQTGWLRRYRVRVHGEVDEAALAGLKDGIAVDGVFYGAVEAALDRRQGTNAWLTVGLREGKNREVRNIMAALGLEVTRLIRVSYGPFQLGELPEGEVQELRGRTLRDQLGPRLIAEAGADFDAPVVRPFSSKPQDEAAERPASGRQGAGTRASAPAREEAGRRPRGRKPDRTDRRDAALARLSTTAPAGRRPRRAETAPREEGQVRRSRASNVWMAPGARPLPEKEAADGEKVVRVPRKPGDRKANHDAAARRPRPGRAERAAAKEGAERPRRPWQPKPEGEAGPKRDWKARPPRPGKAERPAVREGREPAPRAHGPHPQRRDEDGPPQRRPRPEGSGRHRPEKGERGPREGATSKPFSPRPRGEGKGGGQRAEFREGGERSDVRKSDGAGFRSGRAGARQASFAGPPPRKREGGGKPSGPGKPGGGRSGRPGPRKGPGKPRGRG